MHEPLLSTQLPEMLKVCLGQTFNISWSQSQLLPTNPLLLTKDGAASLHTTLHHYKTRKTDPLTTFSLVLHYVTHGATGLNTHLIIIQGSKIKQSVQNVQTKPLRWSGYREN